METFGRDVVLDDHHHHLARMRVEEAAQLARRRRELHRADLAEGVAQVHGGRCARGRRSDPLVDPYRGGDERGRQVRGLAPERPRELGVHTP